MTNTRDQLIADWRQELAAAEGTLERSPRPAWLARMRVRLYRFLLACYGDQAWSGATDDEAAAAEPLEAATSVLFDANASPLLDGKPAKSIGKIRSVLQAVSLAQGDSHAPGPLAGGLDGESWVIVAAASSKLKTGRCCELLRAAGLHARTAYRGDDHMVEVPARERREAFAIVERNRRRVHTPPNTPRTQRIPLWARFAAAAIVSMWVAGLLAASLVALVWISIADFPSQTFPNFLDMPEFYQVWGALFVAFLLLGTLRLGARPRPTRAAKPGPRA